MYLSALFTLLLTSFYFPGIVLPQILQPCLLDACFLSFTPLSSIITLLPRVKVKQPQLLLKARVREFLCLKENNTTKTQCSCGFLYRLQKKQATCLFVSPPTFTDNPITSRHPRFPSTSLSFLARWAKRKLSYYRMCYFFRSS